MGKRGKKHREAQRYHGGEEEEDALPSSAYDLPSPPVDREHRESASGEEREDDGGGGRDCVASAPSKFSLYQLSVQSPKGDISYMQKFFLMYVGGRFPLHLQEDFCGTALLRNGAKLSLRTFFSTDSDRRFPAFYYKFGSCEWLRSDSRRTAVGVDLDLEALDWCFENNLSKVGADGYSRISLFHGNVLRPEEAHLVKHPDHDLIKELALADKSASPPSRDIVCAFNYSCCCLHKRKDLVLYFKHALTALSKKGGIFVMDLYGGASSECKLRLQRRFSNFTYVWEQAEFDVLNRRTRISLHFHLGKQQIMCHAFSYDWRLWSIPEIKDCLEEAGFQSIHVWIRKMPDTSDDNNKEEFSVGRDVKYEELSSFQQQDAWNAYIVGVANT